MPHYVTKNPPTGAAAEMGLWRCNLIVAGLPPGQGHIFLSYSQHLQYGETHQKIPPLHLSFKYKLQTRYWLLSHGVTSSIQMSCMQLKYPLADGNCVISNHVPDGKFLMWIILLYKLEKQ